jgi:hypothetical protein
MAFPGPHRPTSTRSKFRVIVLGAFALLLVPLAIGSIFSRSDDAEGGPRICMMGLMIFVALLIATSYTAKQSRPKPPLERTPSAQEKKPPPLPKK